jgi:Bacterial Ig-like domain (group 2)
MKTRNTLRAIAMAVTMGILACTGDVNAPRGTGDVALNFEFQGAASAPLDAMTVALTGPKTATVDLVLNNGFWEGTADNLPVGTYTLTALGLGGGQVTYFGVETGVTVTADQTTTASVTISEFVPTISSITPPGPTKIMTFRVAFSPVIGATTYRVEWVSGSVGGFVEGTNTTMDVPVTVLGNVEFTVRAGNAVVDPEDAAGSTPQSVTTEGDNAAKDQASAPNLGSGSPTNVTVVDHNIAPAGEEDWVFVNVVGGERLTARVRTETLPYPSALDPVLTVYDFGGNVVAQNDDRDNTTTESEIVYVPPASGQHYIVVSGAGSSVGHYELTVQIDNNQPVGYVEMSPPAATLRPSISLQIEARPFDNLGGSELFRPVTLTSSDPSVVSVDANGLVRGLSAGRATITAESEGVGGKTEITVRSGAATTTPPTIDGVLSPGEWDTALQIPTGPNAGTIANATVYVQNDGVNLFMALAVPDATAGTNDILELRFDNDNDRVQTVNDDEITVSRTAGLSDGYFNGTSWGTADARQDGVGAASLSGGMAYYEWSHPLASGDVNDMMVSGGNFLGFCIRYFNDGSSSGSYPSNCILAFTEQRAYHTMVIDPQVAVNIFGAGRP